MGVARDVPHEDAHLAVIDFASVAAPLALHAHRMPASLREAAGIKGDDAIRFPQLLDHLSDQHREQRAMSPGRSADKLLQDQALDIDEGGDRLRILAVQVGQEAYQIEMHMAFASLGPKRVLIGLHEVAQTVNHGCVMWRSPLCGEDDIRVDSMVIVMWISPHSARR
jgi:hypothetical protein